MKTKHIFLVSLLALVAIFTAVPAQAGHHHYYYNYPNYSCHQPRYYYGGYYGATPYYYGEYYRPVYYNPEPVIYLPAPVIRFGFGR